MSKLIVSQVVTRARYDADRAENEAAMDPKFRAIQDAFSNSPSLRGEEGLAELCGLITGFRPRASTCKIQPFQVFALVSKGETRTIKFALCVVACSGGATGCASLAEAAIGYDENTCRIATSEEAEAFIVAEVSRWEDSALLNWLNTKLGANYFAGFFTELERSVPSLATMSKK